MIAIAACDERGVIGREGKLPWHCPEDLAHFYNTTRSHSLIMGYRTYCSLPAHAFIDRRCFVLTRSHSIDRAGVIAVRDLPDLYKGLASISEAEMRFVIGGASIFQLFFSERLIRSALITHIHGTYAGDAYFPLHWIQPWLQQEVSRWAGARVVLYTVPNEEHDRIAPQNVHVLVGEGCASSLGIDFGIGFGKTAAQNLLI